MASDFNIISYDFGGSLYLRLYGNFDGSSAHELINILKEHGNSFWDIYIDTNELKMIHPFGRDAFQKNLNGIEKQLKNLMIIGANKHKIAPKAFTLEVPRL